MSLLVALITLCSSDSVAESLSRSLAFTNSTVTLAAQLRRGGTLKFTAPYGTRTTVTLIPLRTNHTRLLARRGIRVFLARASKGEPPLSGSITVRGAQELYGFLRKPNGDAIALQRTPENRRLSAVETTIVEFGETLKIPGELLRPRIRSNSHPGSTQETKSLALAAALADLLDGKLTVTTLSKNGEGVTLHLAKGRKRITVPRSTNRLLPWFLDEQRAASYRIVPETNPLWRWRSIAPAGLEHTVTLRVLLTAPDGTAVGEHYNVAATVAIKGYPFTAAAARTDLRGSAELRIPLPAIDTLVQQTGTAMILASGPRGVGAAFALPVQRNEVSEVTLQLHGK